MSDYKNRIVELLNNQLEIIGITSKAVHDCVLFGRWPTLAFRILDIDINQPTTNNVVVHIHICTELNMKYPESFINTCCVGIGNDIDQAILDGVNVWCQVESSVVFSLLNQHPIMGTEWCPNGDPLGVPGWDCFLSPYVLRVGQQTKQDILSTFIQEHPLIETIRMELANLLDRERPFHSISIFRGVVKGASFADCHVNGVAIPILGEMLLLSPWPTADINFGTIRQSLLLLNPRKVS